jgi:hypothetical protein
MPAESGLTIFRRNPLAVLIFFAFFAMILGVVKVKASLRLQGCVFFHTASDGQSSLHKRAEPYF